MTRKAVKNSAEMVAVMCGAGIDPERATFLIGTSKQGMACEMAPQDTEILLIVDPDDHTKDITFVPYASEELRLSGKHKSNSKYKTSMRKKYDT